MNGMAGLIQLTPNLRNWRPVICRELGGARRELISSWENLTYDNQRMALIN
jgi:hypothetical protein